MKQAPSTASESQSAAGTAASSRIGVTRDEDSPRCALIEGTLALFALALFASTWRLWTPQSVFPQVPFFRALIPLPRAIEWLGAAAIVLSLVAVLVAPYRGRWATFGLLGFVAATFAMLLVDQERLQPWVCQFMVMALILALADGRTALGLLRLLIISFYLHSALSKFDHAFLHTLGQQFLLALPGGAAVEAWSEPWRLAAAAVFPTGELAVAAGLCFAATRRWALWAAIGLHLILLVILGPWGLNHKPGVLIWNVYFIVQDVILFRGSSSAREDQRRDGVAVPRRWHSLPAMAAYAAVLLPFLAPIGWLDVWPAWGLYAASADRITVLVHRSAFEQLPDALRGFCVSSDDAGDPWLDLRLDRWALDALGAPIYPAGRFQLGVAEAVIARYQLDHRARVVRSSIADRFTGARRYEVLTGGPQVVDASSGYWFNTHPRPFARHASATIP